MSSRSLWVLAALMVAGIAAFRATRVEPKPRQAGLNVLLVTIDTLRADAIGAYGSKTARTPWIDRLANEGVRFDAAHAHNVTTLASHANILSGLLPTQHGVRDNAGFRLPAGVPTLATLLKSAGYRTAAFVSAFPVDSRFGLARGFDVYDDRFVDAQARPAFLEQERSAAATVKLARAWIEAASTPWFAWVHLYEPHAPYAPPEPFAGSFQGRPYDGEVAAVDAALQPLVEPHMDERGRRDTLVVLTSDHGESLGEHGEATHGIFAYEATLRVPLVVYQPRLLRPLVTSVAASHVDLLPTILDAVALPVPDGLAGRSLVDAAAARPVADAATYFEALSGQLNRGWAPLHGVIEGGAKYVDLPLPELYDLGLDKAETTNLAAKRPQALEALRRRLATFRARDAGAQPSRESEATLEKLRSLGYLGAGDAAPKQAYTEADDPKTLVPLDAALQHVVGLFTSGSREEALARCRSLVGERPGMPLGFVYLAQLERESGNLEGSVRALKRALSLNPQDTVVATLLAADLTQLGRASEAMALLEPWASRAEPDLDVLVTRALAAARLQRGDEALAALERARELDPSSARVLVALGSVRLTAGQRAEARAAFEQALVQNPAAAQAETALAMMAAEDGRMDEARQRFARAFAADPAEAGKLLALAAHLAAGGRRDEARGLLELFAEQASPALFARELEQVRAVLGAPGPTRAGGR